MLDDHRRKAVAAVGDFSHRASLPSASLPSYPVTLTKPHDLLDPFYIWFAEGFDTPDLKEAKALLDEFSGG
jgi:hypothetical protein